MQVPCGSQTECVCPRAKSVSKSFKPETISQAVVIELKQNMTFAYQ